MEPKAPSIWKAAAIGGAAAGVASAIPFVNWINCACCALIIGGGFLAAFVYSRDCAAAGVGFRAGNGAFVGLAAAPIYALVGLVVGGLIQIAVGFSVERIFDQIEQMPNVPPEQIEEARRFVERVGTGGLALIAFVVNLLFGAVFSTVGGLIGGAAFKREIAPVPPVAPPPTTPPTTPTV